MIHGATGQVCSFGDGFYQLLGSKGGDMGHGSLPEVSTGRQSRNRVTRRHDGCGWEPQIGTWGPKVLAEILKRIVQDGAPQL